MRGGSSVHEPNGPFDGAFGTLLGASGVRVRNQAALGCPGRYLGARYQAQLLENIFDMALGGCWRNNDLVGDLLIREASAQQDGDVEFPLRQANFSPGAGFDAV